jgi:hypothetical protein
MAMNPPSDNLPLAEVLRGANELLAAKWMEDWALGGALAAICVKIVRGMFVKGMKRSVCKLFL